jgi:hypothetical protein
MENIIYILRDNTEAVIFICVSIIGYLCFHMGRALGRQEGGY